MFIPSKLILVLVVIGLATIETSQASDDQEKRAKRSLSSPQANLLRNLKQMELADQTLPGGQVRALDLVDGGQAVVDLNDNEDHSNIDLEKLNQALRYEVMPRVGNEMDASSERNWVNEGDADGLARLFSRIALITRGDKLMRGQMDRRQRSIGQIFEKEREDKDYSFVGSPASMNRYSASNRQRDARWATQKLRDLMMANERAFKFANANLNQLSQLNGPFGVSSDASENTPNNREKRRRCKIDPNLGVKNPAFCDTDAYFGAADYSMRDVWDSAGR